MSSGAPGGTSPQPEEPPLFRGEADTGAAAPVKTAPDAPHILVVDDDTRIRSLLTRYLKTNGFRVSAAQNAAEARSLTAGLEFDLLVLDIMMPGEDGLSLTRFLRRISDVPILLLTARGDAAHRIEGLESGADDYLPKPFEPRELLLRAETIIRRSRRTKATPEIRFGDCTYDRQKGELTKAGALVHLTTAERALLTILTGRMGQTISRDDLCTETGMGAVRSVDVQVTRLRRKIEPDPKLPAFLRTVRGEGYVFYGD